MAGAEGEERQVVRRVRCRASSLGLSVPPVPAELKVLDSRLGQPNAIVRTTGRLEDALAWVDGWSPTMGRPLRRASSHVILCQLPARPPAWRTFPPGCQLTHVRLFPSGVAHAVLTGPASVVEAVARELTEGMRAERQDVGPRLTPRQSRALAEAAEMGYYRIPRPVTLKALAGRLDVSVASASELLRRAENEVILSHVRRFHPPPPRPEAQGV